MTKITLLIVFVLFVNINLGCSNQNPILSEENFDTPELMYQNAMIEFDNKSYDIAQKIFEDINYKFPLSNEAIQSQIMIGFIYYIKINYEDAILKFNQIIIRYPSHKDIDYAYYMLAMCYYEKIESADLDGSNNIKALEKFNQIINRFPNSMYAQDSQQKIILIKENIAAKHMSVALFYLKQKKYLAALNRYNKVVNDFSKSRFTPEALHRLIEIYITLGLSEEAKKIAAVLSYNYPKSQWYKQSYDLLKKND